VPPTPPPPTNSPSVRIFLARSANGRVRVAILNPVDVCFTKERTFVSTTHRTTSPSSFWPRVANPKSRHAASRSVLLLLTGWEGLLPSATQETS